MPGFKLVQIGQKHLSDLRELTPPDWNSDISLFYKIHRYEKYLHAIGVESDDKLIACGFAIINMNAAWIGNIVVNNNFRKLGLGTEITSSLIRHCKNSGCTTLLLIATKLGEPVYTRLGFQTEAEYIFFKGTNYSASQNDHSIKPITESDYDRVLNLDFDITGESRDLLIRKFLKTGLIYVNDKNEIDGFYMPDFGNGLIIAKNKTAGLELLKRKHIGHESTVVIPSKNEAAIKFLLENNFHEFLRAPRMILGEKILWKQECIFSRAAGYSG